MNGKVSYKLKSKLDELGIDLIFKKMKRRGYYWPDMNTIIINEELILCNEVNFAIAYELAHALKKHKEISIRYASSYSTRSKLQAEANIQAIRILVDVYLEENDMNVQEFNSVRFMKCYGINSSLYPSLKKVLLSHEN